MVALREANLKALPSAVAELGPLARTLDASNNRIGEGLQWRATSIIHHLWMPSREHAEVGEGGGSLVP